MISWRVDVRRNRAHRSSFWERRRPGRSRRGRSDSPPSHDPIKANIEWLHIGGHRHGTRAGDLDRARVRTAPAGKHDG